MLGQSDKGGLLLVLGLKLLQAKEAFEDVNLLEIFECKREQLFWPMVETQLSMPRRYLITC